MALRLRNVSFPPQSGHMASFGALAEAVTFFPLVVCANCIVCPRFLLLPDKGLFVLAGLMIFRWENGVKKA